MRIPLVSLLITAVSLHFVSGGDIFQPLTLQQVLQQMEERDRVRSAALAGYTCLRRYVLDNRRFHARAELSARMTYDWPGRKKFEVLAEKGPSVIRQRVLRRMLQAEEEASRDEVREHTRITPLNYEFQLLAVQVQEGRSLYVLSLNPKTRNKFLMRGRIWVDSGDFAIVRVEATPAKNPSTWIRNTHVVQQYAKFGMVWLPVSSRSEADSFVFGRTDVTIESSGYEINWRPAHVP